MFLNQSKKTNQFPALHILVLVVSCFINMSCCKSVGASEHLRVPPAPKYDSSLTNEDIEFLLAILINQIYVRDSYLFKRPR